MGLYFQRFSQFSSEQHASRHGAVEVAESPMSLVFTSQAAGSALTHLTGHGLSLRPQSHLHSDAFLSSNKSAPSQGPFSSQLPHEDKKKERNTTH